MGAGLLATLREYARMARESRRPAAWRRHVQAQRLAGIVRHAGLHVPFYRERFAAAGLAPESIRGMEDLPRIPVTPKTDFRRAPPEQRMAEGWTPADCRVKHTSGSTGIPLNVYFSGREEAERAALWLRARMRHRLWPWLRYLLIGYYRPSPPPWYARRLRLHVSLDDAWEQARRFRPHVLSAYPTQMLALARDLQRRGLPPPRARAIRTGGELLLPPVRRLLEDTFGAPVHDFYAAVEFGVLGSTCPARGGFHLTSDDHLLEVTRDGQPVGPGEEGEILVTSLVARAMPLIRYAIGDVGALADEASCPCGNPFPRIAGLAGRSEEMLVLPGGRRASPRLAAIPFWENTDIAQYRVTQHAVGVFEIDLVPAGAPDPALPDTLRDYFRKHFAAETTEVRILRQLDPDPSGKLRKVIVLAQDAP